MSEIYHITPVDDLKEHEGTGLRCWCEPVVKDEGVGTLVIHNSADGREFYEEDGEVREKGH
jgi:GAF domain-containing protein